jgi:signal transduction histidine kinase
MVPAFATAPHMPDRLQSPTAQRATTTATSARRALMADFVAAGELERRRVAEAIHDDSIQAIAALSMRLQMVRRSLGDADELSVLDEAERAVQLAIRRLRVLVFELQPPGLDGEGVSVALAIALEAANREGALHYRLDDRLETQPGADDGRGFDPDLIASGPAGYGFASMRTRTRLAGGDLRIDSPPGGGTTVEAWLPDGRDADGEREPA